MIKKESLVGSIKMNRRFWIWIIPFAFVFSISIGLPETRAQGELLNSGFVSNEAVSKNIVPALKPEEIKVEMVLARKWKKEDKIIKQKLRDSSVKRVMIQYFRFGDPPTNIVIGRDVPADIARLAIEIALAYNNDIKTILPEFRFFPHYIGIGSSAFDEQAEIPIFPEELERLRDPSLSTEEFHALYRSYTGEEEDLPTY